MDHVFYISVTYLTEILWSFSLGVLFDLFIDLMQIIW